MGLQGNFGPGKWAHSTEPLALVESGGRSGLIAANMPSSQADRDMINTKPRHRRGIAAPAAGRHARRPQAAEPVPVRHTAAEPRDRIRLVCVARPDRSARPAGPA